MGLVFPDPLFLSQLDYSFTMSWLKNNQKQISLLYVNFIKFTNS